MTPRWLRRTAVIIGVVCLAVVAFAAGTVWDRLGSVSPANGTPTTSIGTAVSEVARVIEQNALEGSSETTLTSGAIRGMLESIEDSHAAYYDARHYEYLIEQTSGTFYGIGVTIMNAEDRLVVTSVVEGSPAEAVGILPDDVIVSIDGAQPAVWDINDAVLLIRGEEGTTVDLGVQRGDEAELRMFTVTRAAIDVPNIESELVEGDVGYIYLYSFNEQATDDVRNAIETLTAQGARSFVLDLRDNPGGLLSSAVGVSSLFVSDGVIVRVEDRDGAVERYDASGRTATDAPLVVLINGNSASASEIVAGALQDYGRAKLVGERSFGKGSVQEIERLSFGGAVKLTVAHYVTPKNRVIDGIGLTPDIVLEMERELAADKETDTQLKRAIEVLRAER